MQLPLLFGNPNDLSTKVNRQNAYLHVRNAGSTTILRGTPACYAMNGTRDGFDVFQSSDSSTNKSTAYFAGIAMQDIVAGEVGLVLASGVADFVRCSAAVAVETTLTVNPAANNFVAGGTVAAVIAIATVGPVVLPALVNAVATATVDGVTNVSARVFVRAL